MKRVCLLDDPSVMPVVVSIENIDHLRKLGVLNRLVGKWPIGNTGIEEVVESLMRTVEDPHTVVRMTYQYPYHPESGDQVRAELVSFTVHCAVHQTQYVDILKQFCS